MSAIVFLDCETTGLSLDDDIWEFAAIRREEDGTEAEWHLFVQHSEDKCARLPEPFHADHMARYDQQQAWSREDAAAHLHVLFADRPHIVGAVPNFDTERMARLLAKFDLKPGWHYHLIDVENLVVGYLAGRASMGDLNSGLALPLQEHLPWDSEELSHAVGVDPERFERHTAMGDVRWAMAIYDAMMGGSS